MKKDEFEIVVRGDISRPEWLYLLVTINKMLKDYAYPIEAILENKIESTNLRIDLLEKESIK